jgi:hypothetical protein
LCPRLVRTEGVMQFAEHLDLTGSQSPEGVGRVVAALATDDDVMSLTGRALVVADLAHPASPDPDRPGLAGMDHGQYPVVQLGVPGRGPGGSAGGCSLLGSLWLAWRLQRRRLWIRPVSASSSGSSRGTVTAVAARLSTPLTIQGEARPYRLARTPPPSARSGRQPYDSMRRAPPRSWGPGPQIVPLPGVARVALSDDHTITDRVGGDAAARPRLPIGGGSR